MKGRIEIIKYMNANIADHVDPLTGEVNATALAEDACWHFDDCDGDDVPEEYFEYAHEVATRYEIKTGIKQGKISGLSGLINSRESDWF